MKIFLSDLHLGNILFSKSKALINLLKSGRYDKVYILGDTLDIWSMELEHILMLYGDLIKTINDLGVNCVILKGNHDPDLKILCEVFNRNIVLEGHYRFSLNLEPTVLLHGDEFDNSGAFWMFVYKCIAPIQWIFTKAGMSFAYRLRDYYYKLKHGSDFYKKLTLANEKNTIKKYSVNNKIIIMGHTHLAKIVQTPEYKYINCGTALYESSAIEFNGIEFNLVRY